jgi:hypothetical protein
VAAIAARAEGERWTDTAGRWMRDGGALLAAGVVTSVLWVIIHNAIALVSLTHEPTLEGLRGGSQSLGGVLVVATTFFQPLTDLVFSPDTLGQQAQHPFRTALAFLLIGGGFAGLFVSPRSWNHVLGLISVPALYFGGVIIGLGFIVGFGTDAGAGVSGRYGLSIAPLLLLSLAASLRGKWPVAAVGTLAATSFVVTAVVMAT